MSKVNSYQFTASAGTNDRFVLHITPDVSSVISVDSDMADDEPYYTIDGIKLDMPSRPGIYIHNNKKVYIK